MILEIYTDGACKGNPGIGGWGYVIKKNEYVSKNVCNCDGDLNTTNNIMEMTAVIKALGVVKKRIERDLKADYHKVTIFSDSAYIINAINLGWVLKWKQNGWKTTANKDVKNISLWKALDKVMSDLKYLNVRVAFIKVKGHSNDEYNNIADKLANEGVLKAKGRNQNEN